VAFWNLDNGLVPEDIGARAVLASHLGPISLPLLAIDVEECETPGSMLFACDPEYAEALDWSVPGWGRGFETSLSLQLSDDGPVVSVTGFFVHAGRLSAEDERAHFAYRYRCDDPGGRSLLQKLWDECNALIATQFEVPILRDVA